MESKLPNSIEELPQPLREAIQKLIDEKVQEKFNNFMGEYSDVLAKLKSQRPTTAPGAKITRPTTAGGDIVKNKNTAEGGEDTPTASKVGGATGAVKRPPV